MKSAFKAKIPLAWAALAAALLFSASYSEGILMYSKSTRLPKYYPKLAQFLVEANPTVAKLPPGKTRSFFLRDSSFGYVLAADASTLSRPSFSKSNQGYVAYLWSDGVAGKATAAKAAPLAKAALGPMGDSGSDPEGSKMKTSLAGLFLRGQNLQLVYTLSHPGQVHVEVFGISGRVLGEWRWEDARPGAHTREINFGGLPNTGIFLVRLESGGDHVLQKIIATGH